MLSAAQLDLADPLAPFRDRFVIDDPDLVYLKGNSLGRLPKAALAQLEDAVRAQWGGRLVRAWNEGWYDAPARIGGKIAPLIGAEPGEVIVSGSTSANLHALLFASLEARPDRNEIVTDDRNFPSDLYVMQGLRGATVRVAGRDGALEELIGPKTGVVSLSHVVFREGFRHDMAAVTSLAQRHGAWSLWDLSHSAGVCPVSMGHAEMAVGCTYKYLNGGPGAPAFLYVREDLQPLLRPPVQGWFGHADPFAFELDYRPAGGMGKFLAGTPPILSMLGIEAGASLCLEAGMERIWEKAVGLTSRFLELASGLSVETPLEPERRGAHVSILHPEAFRLSRALIDRGIICDYREPSVLRFGFSPLYTRYVDVDRAWETLSEILEAGLHLAYPEAKPAVT